MKCWECKEDVLEGEIYTDFYYCIHCMCNKEINRPERSKREDTEPSEIKKAEYRTASALRKLFQMG